MFMYLCVRDIDFASISDFDIRFWNCSDSVVYFGFHCIIHYCSERVSDMITLVRFLTTMIN